VSKASDLLIWDATPLPSWSSVQFFYLLSPPPPQFLSLPPLRARKLDTKAKSLIPNSLAPFREKEFIRRVSLFKVLFPFLSTSRMMGRKRIRKLMIE